MGEAAARRSAYNFYFQDAWKVTPRLSVNYGLRYEVNSRISEAHHLTAKLNIVNPEGAPAFPWEKGATLRYVVNPQPPYGMDWRGWGPRLALDWRITDHTIWHAGAAISTILSNLWQDNSLTGGFPFVVGPYVTAQPGVAVPFANSVTALQLPPVYTVDGRQIYAQDSTTAVPPNTQIDMMRFQRGLDGAHARPPGPIVGSQCGFPRFPQWLHRDLYRGVRAFDRRCEAERFLCGHRGDSFGAPPGDQRIRGRRPAFAPFLKTDSSGNVTGGYGTSYLMSTRSHSTYHALQTGVEKTSARAGLGFQASYTYSKSLDDTSAVLGGVFASSGPVLQTMPQDPRHPGLEKGPSTFDTTQVFTLSVVQALPFDRAGFLRPVNKKVTSGWQILNITTLTSGSPFTVYSGIQQTGMGSGGADRPDQIGRPVFSTSRTVREDYFGKGNANGDFFQIPIGVPGGTGPNQGVFGTLGRNTFRGPGYYDLDFSLIKDTDFGRRGNPEAMVLQFRAEFFNLFNLVNFGLPMNVMRGTGFGIINRTAGTSRQIQFSLKLIF